MDEKDYSGSYSEENFWDKVSENAKNIGKAPLLNALKLFYALKLRKATPLQVTAIIAALGYLISPIDAVPDPLPGGFIDDAGVLATAVATLACCAKEEVIAAAKQKLKEWFG